MNPTTTTPLQAAIRQELHRARDDRLFAGFTRAEATQLEREAARVARAAGLSAAQIAHEIGVSRQRAYQLIDPKGSA